MGFHAPLDAGRDAVRQHGVRVPPPSNDSDAPPGLFTAFQEQLGLKLQSMRAPVEVLVVAIWGLNSAFKRIPRFRRIAYQ